MEPFNFFETLFRASASLFTLIFIASGLLVAIKKEIFVEYAIELWTKLATILFGLSTTSSLSYIVLEYVETNIYPIGINIHENTELSCFLFILTTISFVLGMLATAKAGFSIISRVREGP